MEPLTKKQAAAKLGISRPTLDKALKDGRATLDPLSYTPGKTGRPFKGPRSDAQRAWFARMMPEERRARRRYYRRNLKQWGLFGRVGR